MSIEVRNISPSLNSIHVPINTNIEFDLVGLSGDEIDIETLSVDIEMNSKIISGEVNTFTYDLGADPDLTEITYIGDTKYYRVTVTPTSPFDEGQAVTIKINVSTKVISPAIPEEMVEYSYNFYTVNQGLISDFKFAFIESAQAIPVYGEILRPNKTTGATIFHSAFKNWNLKPQVVVRRNQVIIEEGFTIDYENGRIIFKNSDLEHGPIEIEDQIDVDYTFSYFSDKQIQSYFDKAKAIWNVHPPFGGPGNIYTTSNTLQSVFMVGAASFAFRELLFGLAVQERRIIWDNESWDEGWKNVKDLFSKLSDEYKGDWEKLLTAKQYQLPSIAAVVTPSYTLPGGRSRFFRYLYK